jgi:hypothetical protein
MMVAPVMYQRNPMHTQIALWSAYFQYLSE